MGEQDGRFVAALHDARGHNAHHAFVPVRAIEYNAAARFVVCSRHGLCFLEGAEVVFAAQLVAVFQHPAVLGGHEAVLGQHQSHSLPGVGHAPGGINHRRQSEHNIADVERARAATFLNKRVQSGLVAAVELLQSVPGQHPVFAGHGHDVGGDADDQKIEQRLPVRRVHLVAGRVGLRQFEGHAAAAEFFVRIRAIGAFGV